MSIVYSKKWGPLSTSILTAEPMTSQSLKELGLHSSVCMSPRPPRKIIFEVAAESWICATRALLRAPNGRCRRWVSSVVVFPLLRWRGGTRGSGEAPPFRCEERAAPLPAEARTAAGAAAAQFGPGGCSPGWRRCPSPPVLKLGGWDPACSRSPDRSPPKGFLAFRPHLSPGALCLGRELIASPQ